MNWGHKITLAILLFVAFIGYMVVRAFQENIDLVSDDYYAREISFEDKMRQQANFNVLEDPPTVLNTGEEIIITFPGTSHVDGIIHFYHPSRELFDKYYELSIAEDRSFVVNRNDLVAGLYRVNMTWRSDDKEYFQQESLFIQ